MRALDMVLQNLRPLVGENGWDYGVVWKLGDYSTTRLRFIEMMGCCCGGANKEIQVNAEEKKLQLCKDMVFPHPKSTKACDALASYPTSIPLSFGIHMEVLVSGQPRWICSDEMSGTRVLIPVVGALIELFAATQVPMDHQMIEHIMVQCNEKQEARITSMDETYNMADSHCITSKSLMNNEHLLEGSPTDPLPLLSPLSSTGITGRIVESLMTSPPEHMYVSRQKKRSVSNCGNNKENCLIDLKNTGVSQKSRNLLIERNRRNKLKSKILTLRSLVPNITKMDIQSTLGDASSYIEELQKKVESLQHELKDVKEEDAHENVDLESQNIAAKTKTEDCVSNHLSPSEISTDQSKHNHDSLISNDNVEEQVEVSELGEQEFLLKLVLEKRRGWFWRLMQAMNVLGLSVTEANVITFDGRIMNIFKVEAKNEVIEAEQLKDSMLKLIQTGLLIDKE